jgi:guanyl-specific ribonuclease Sa
LTLVGGQTISTTEDHPFWSKTRNTFVRSDELTAGEALLGANGETKYVLHPISFWNESAVRGQAYNLAVADIHTYHVSGADILVHNTCGPIPIGPAEEDAWRVVDRVDSHNSPLPGYKGKRSFENSGKDGSSVLPRTGRNGGPVDYHEWDVAAKVKGVDRGGRRVVTGSDGSAYFTTDHYRTFTQMR